MVDLLLLRILGNFQELLHTSDERRDVLLPGRLSGEFQAGNCLVGGMA